MIKIKRTFLLLLLAFLCGQIYPTLAYAQITDSLQAVNTQGAPEEVTQISQDPLGRSTPRGTIQGYVEAIARENYEKAAQYFDLSYVPKRKRDEKAAEIARNFQRLLNFNGTLLPNNFFSDKPSGRADDFLEDNLDKAGSFILEGETVPVLLEKVEQAEHGPIWLFSAQTLEKVPDTLDIADVSKIEKYFPQVLLENKWDGVSYAHWLMIAILTPLSFLVAWLTAKIGIFIMRRIVHKFWPNRHTGLVEAFALPFCLFSAAWLFSTSTQKMGISIIARQNFSEITVIVAWIAFVLLLWRLVNVFAEVGIHRTRYRGDTGRLSAVLFFRRVAKFVLIGVGCIFVLDIIGVDITTGLAALGIGGLALALGAQKTIENLVGSLTVIFDQPVRVGDYCQVGEIAGTIEQIGMRSTRIRTLDRTVVTIPNGDFSAQKIENYALRDMFRYRHILGLRYETSPDQIRYLLVELRKIFYAHPRVNDDPARVRFLGFGASSLDIEIFAYVRANDYNEFLEVQEDLNLRVFDVVNESGSGFAFPSQTVYMAQDQGLDKAKTKTAEKQVKDWIANNDLQIPQFDFETIKDLEDTLSYPPEGSGMKKTDPK